MSLGKRESEDQREFWLPMDRLATGPGHVFYDKLQRLLADHGFDLFAPREGEEAATCAERKSGTQLRPRL